jgi:hypothetical protein
MRKRLFPICAPTSAVASLDESKGVREGKEQCAGIGVVGILSLCLYFAFGDVHRELSLAPYKNLAKSGVQVARYPAVGLVSYGGVVYSFVSFRRLS